MNENFINSIKASEQHSKSRLVSYWTGKGAILADDNPVGREPDEEGNCFPRVAKQTHSQVRYSKHFLGPFHC